MSAAAYRSETTIRRNAQETRILCGLVWMMLVASVETVGDVLVGAVRRY